MKAKKLAMFLFALAALAGLTVLAGCTRESGKFGYQPNSGAGQTAEQEQQTPGQPNTGEAADKVDNAAEWKKYELGDYSFAYPAGWTVEVSKKLNADDADLYITLKSTNKAVVLGGAAPDDYYVEKDGKNFINVEKYADSFALITVDVYQGSAGLDWQALADKIYPDVVETFAPYSVGGRTDIEAVKVDKVKGIIGGSPCLFVRTKKAAYEVDLQYKNWEVKDAEAVLNKFFVQFPF